MESPTLHQFVLTRLQESKGTWPEVATRTGLSVRTIRKIATGEIEDPGVSHIEKLANYFKAREARSPLN